MHQLKPVLLKGLQYSLLVVAGDRVVIDEISVVHVVAHVQSE
jgi:hypothetical protein